MPTKHKTTMSFRLNQATEDNLDKLCGVWRGVSRSDAAALLFLWLGVLEEHSPEEFEALNFSVPKGIAVPNPRALALDAETVREIDRFKRRQKLSSRSAALSAALSGWVRGMEDGVLGDWGLWFMRRSV